MTVYRGASVPGSGKKTEAAAVDITIDDAGAYYNANNVEDALQETAAATRAVESDLAIHLIDYTNPHQVVASQVNISDTAGHFVATEVEAALAEEALARETHVADTANPHSVTAVQVPITDAGGYYTSTDVEGALQEVSSLISGSSIQYFTENRNTTAPNATVPVHSWEATGAETDIDVALVPKGSAAITAHVPDGTASGGDKRGLYAVDLQTSRVSSPQVASGQGSVIVGGRSNTASGSYSAIIGGSTNTTSGTGSVAFGGYATDRGQLYRFSFSAATAGSVGAAQVGLLVLSSTTTDATTTVLTSGGYSVTASRVAVLPDYNSHAVIAVVVARGNTGVTKMWRVEGAVRRSLGVANTYVVGTPTKTVIAADAGTSTWDCNLVANTSRGSAEIEVTGEAGKTIDWVCKFDTVEVG